MIVVMKIEKYKMFNVYIPVVLADDQEEGPCIHPLRAKDDDSKDNPGEASVLAYLQTKITTNTK